ncbi:MAG: carboxypeptidase-like regulatory domain-containing protein [Bryobacteraceae bacterium]
MAQLLLNVSKHMMPSTFANAPRPTMIAGRTLRWAIVLLCLRMLAAQGNGAISGTVVDAAGNPVPFVEVTLLGHHTDYRCTLAADSGGKFRVAGLAPDRYTVVVASPVCGISVSTAVVENGKTTSDAIVLYDPPPPGDEDAGRAYLDSIRERAEIAPGQQGSATESAGPYAFRANMSFNANGQRGQNNNFRLDGMDNNDNWTGSAILNPPAEAIAAASLMDGYIPAASGHATGASVSVYTRSASNALHGSAYEEFGNSALDARNFFDGARKPATAANQFGANLGGPVRKGGWFFFADLEGLLSRQGLTVISTVPTAAQKAGDYAFAPIYNPFTIAPTSSGIFERQPFTGNQIPPSLFSPAGEKLLALYPDPNLPGAADNYRYTPSAPHNAGWFHGRSEKRLSAQHSLSVAAGYEHEREQSPGALPAPAGLPLSPASLGSDITQNAIDDDTASNAWDAIVAETWTLSPSLINEFHAGVASLHLQAQPLDHGMNWSTLLDIPGLSAAGLPTVSPTGFTSLGAAGAAPFEVRTSNYQVEDTVRWTTARQSWQFGVQAIRRFTDGDAGDFSSRGTFLFTPDYTSQEGSAAPSGDSIASLLLGFPSEAERDVQFSPYHLRAWEFAGFASDQIRLGRLTISAGLRYSLYPPLTEASSRMVNFNYSRTTPALDQFAGQGGVNQYAGLGFNKRAPAPRVGFVLNLSPSGATALRGGFSTGYDAGTYLAEGMLARNPPYASLLDMINGTFQLGPNLTAGLPAPVPASLLTAAALNAAQGSINAIQPENYTPYADQWDLSLEHRLGTGLVFEIGGVGSMGIHLEDAFNANQPFPAPTPYATLRYPYEPYESRITYLNLGGGSTYYGGQVKLRGQVRPGLVVLLSYSQSKSVDDSVAPYTDPQSRPAAPQYTYNARANRGLSPFDIAQRAVLSAQYDPPHMTRYGWLAAATRDWHASTIVTLQTGFPFTPELAVNSLNNGGFQLPNRAGNGILPANQRSYLDWFDTSLGEAGSAFQVPALYQYGNSGFDILRGPGLATTDAALSRSFRLRENLRFETRIAGTNLLNDVDFALPNRFLGVESSGVISHTVTPARQLQLVVRVAW